MFCVKCGTQVADGVKFCTKCGAPMKTPQKPNVAPVQINPKKPQPIQKPAENLQKPVKNIKPTKEKPKKDKKKVKKAIIISAICFILIAGLVVSGILILPKYFGKAEVEILTFTTEDKYISSGVKNKITFTATTSAKVDMLEIFYKDRSAGVMRDNGKGADTKAGDGIYTGTVNKKFSASEFTQAEFICKTGESTSAPAIINIFPVLSAKEAEKAQTNYTNFSNEIIDVEEKYVSNDGYVPADKYKVLIADIEKVVKEQQEDGIVFDYQIEGNSIYVKFTSGLSTIYAPKEEGFDAVGSDVSMTVITAQPQFDEMGGESFGSDFTGYQLPSDTNFILEMLDVSADRIDSNFSNYSFSDSENYDNEQVTLERIRSFSSNQVILWHGHGYYGPIVKSCLVTGENFSWDSFFNDKSYYNDCVTDRIINGLLINNCSKAIISSKYIDEYCGDMDNTFVYLAACSSGKTSHLADAFTRKGAAVVANSADILRTYNTVILYETVNNLTQINPETGTYNTLSVALANAKAKYGANDSDSRYGGHGATPEIFGGTEAENYSFSDEQPSGTLSGKVCKASDRRTEIPGATVSVYSNGNLLKKETADSTGNYEMQVPVGVCEVVISADGYIEFKAYANVEKDSVKYMETFLLIEGDESDTGIASGTVSNALTGIGAPDVTLKFYEHWNNTNSNQAPVATTTTDDDGYYSIELPLGNYSVVASKNSFTNSSFNIVVQVGETENQNGVISPEVVGNSYLITLTWGDSPSDLDSHTEGETSVGTGFHVYYSDKSAYEDDIPVCLLDVDDTSSYGPEHITLNTVSDQPYYYYVHRYSSSGSLAESEAKVTIEQGGVLLAEFHVPTNLGEGRYWNIFAIVDGEIIVENTITDSPDIYYADGE
ncbi:MAG: zinc-ribbon domain-containing protein [Ruminococcaceae bacterium]|nr:zinc-ribbon domain-containing protein [Oscillospiraceae bacterium]